jgi:hypothetical protein
MSMSPNFWPKKTVDRNRLKTASNLQRKRLKIGQSQRSTEEIALIGMATSAGEKVALRSRLDALGDDT